MIEIEAAQLTLIEDKSDLVIPRNSKGQIQWKTLAQNQGLLLEIIEQEAGRLLSQGVEITRSSLKKAKAGGLLHAIHDFYPDEIVGLRRNLEINEQRKPRGYWTLENIRNEATTFYIEQGKLTQARLVKENRQDLSGAIGMIYPGSLTQLKIDLGLNLEQKPSGYWTTERILEEASDFYLNYGLLTPDTLTQYGRVDLQTAIFKKYPGKMVQLRSDLGLEPGPKPAGYWTQERVRESALQFYNQEGKLTQDLLTDRERGDLIGGISHYPGRLTQLKIDLGIKLDQTPEGYYTLEKIRDEAMAFYREKGEISSKALVKAKRSDLFHAIAHHYPGKWVQLRKDLDLPNLRKDNYWTPEKILEEAKNFFSEEGDISLSLLQQKDRKDLCSVIRKKYKGGIAEVRADLGLSQKQKPKGYWKNISNIEQEALEFYEANDSISLRILNLVGRKDLSGGISKYYPGKMPGLLTKLNIQELDLTEPSSEEAQFLIDSIVGK